MKNYQYVMTAKAYRVNEEISEHVNRVSKKPGAIVKSVADVRITHLANCAVRSDSGHEVMVTVVLEYPLP